MNLKALLALPIICILFAGCGQDQYSMEREYYGVQKQFSAVMSNPQATPPMELKKVVVALESFMTRYPGTGVALDAQTTLVRLYTAVKDYTKAQDELIKIGKTYAKSEAVCADAVFMRGAVYEEQGAWDLALAQYQYLVKAYPKTVRGFEAPFFIAMRYKAKLQPDKMMQTLRENITYYKARALEVPVSPLALESRLMIAKCYAELKEWNSAVQVMESVTRDFKDKVPVDVLLIQVANIYIDKLNEAPKARVVLEKIIHDFPKARSAAAAKAMLGKLDKDKK